MRVIIIYPLTLPGQDEKSRAVRKAADLVLKIKDIKKRHFILSGMNAFCDKVISDEDADRIKEAITMTKVDWLFYEEKMEAVRKAEEKTRREERERAAIELLKSGDAVEKIARCLMLPVERVMKLKESLI